MAAPEASGSSAPLSGSVPFLRGFVSRLGAPPDPMTSGNRIS